MTYYRIESPDGGENILMKRESHREVFHTAGCYIDEASIELPFLISMHAGKESGYDQYDPDFEGEYQSAPIEDRFLDFYSESSLMTPALIEALKKAGVENIQIFPVLIKDAVTGEVIEKEYLFVNIIGLISCVNMEKSKASSIGDGYYFHNLSIDGKQANGALIFRLAESTFEIIVAERVAKVINSGEFKGILAESIV